MRKMTLPALAAACFLLASCNNSATVASASDNSKVQHNLDAQHTVVRAIESGNPAGIDSVVSEDFVDHTDHGDVKGRDSLKAMVKMMADSKNKMKMETKSLALRTSPGDMCNLRPWRVYRTIAALSAISWKGRRRDISKKLGCQRSIESRAFTQ